MLSRMRSLFAREHGEHSETRERQKLMLLLKIKEEHISGPGVGTVSDGQEMGWFLEEVDFSWDFQ